MSLSPDAARILECVTDTPESTTAIFRRWAGLEQHKSLTSRLRRERRALGVVLDGLTAQGLLKREIGEAPGYTIPLFSRTDYVRGMVPTEVIYDEAAKFFGD